MKPTTAVSQTLPRSSPTPVPSYAEVLAAYEARRRASDDLLLRKMLQLRDPMNPS
jgi:hypothetical protein